MKTKAFFTISTFLIIACFSLSAQDSIRLNKKNGGYQFRIEKQINATTIKNQYKSGTCWSYSGLSFFESELIRMGKGEHDLSEMFIVRNTYSRKADKFVRMHGKVNFGPGGVFHDVTNVIRDFGMVPNEVYLGNPEYNGKNMHNEMDAVLEAIVSAVITNKNGQLTEEWKVAYESVLDVYLGKIPSEFNYQGKAYTPKTFASSIGLDAKNYIEVTSFSHQPYYTQFPLEIPDNWSWDNVYNVPLEDLKNILTNAINTNYGVAWASDISEKYFSFKDGIAYVPTKDYNEMTQAEKDSMFTKPMKEPEITQEMRQLGFDNYTTGDDHGMHIIGIARDQNDSKYYLIKNSWGEDRNDCKGYFYATENYVLLKTTCIMIHKDAVPKAIAKKMGLK